MANPLHARLLKPTKLKLSDEERLIVNGFTTTCTAKFTAEDVNEGMGVDTALLYEQVQGKLRRSVSPKILIVMKSRMKAGAFAYVLMRHGCEVVVATNGHKAYTSYLRKSSAEFSLCLCQWYMPGLAGRDLSYYEAEGGGRLPFVALLGPGQRATDAIRSGADLFLKLPLLPHLRWVLNLVHPHTSTMAQIRVGAMLSNFEGMRRLLVGQQDVMRHTIETNVLSELVKEDLAQLSEISAMDVGVHMLEAVMATVRAQEAAANAASAPADGAADRLSADDAVAKRGSNASSISSRKKSLKSRVQQLQDEAALEQLKATASARDVQFRAVATSFRNVMMVLNKVRLSLATTQTENHRLREQNSRSVEHVDLLKGQLRSLGVDVMDAKLERLYMPRRLTRSPPPPDPAVEPFHHGVANDPEVDVTQYSKQDLMRALRAAKAAIASANEEIVELTDDLQRIQEYQIEVEEELVGSAGLAVHFHIGDGAGGSFDNPLRQHATGGGEGATLFRSSDELESSTSSASTVTTSFGGGGVAVRGRSGSTFHCVSDEPAKSVMARTRSNRQLNEERLVRSLSMMGPRLQDEFMRQQSVSIAMPVDGPSAASPTPTGQQQGALATIVGGGGGAGTASAAMRRTRSLVHLVTATSGPRGGAPPVASTSPTTTTQQPSSAVRGATECNHSQLQALERQRKKSDGAKLFFARRLFWTAHVNQHLERRLMESEDARGAVTAKFKAVPPVPRCAEKPIPDASNALDALVNSIVELHNTVATEVNTCTAKLAATFPGCSPSLRQLSNEVKNGLVAFNAGQHIIGLNLYLEGKIIKLLSEERDAWTKERAEMERYKFLNPPGSRKMIADLKTSVRELRLYRWKDWFHGNDVKLRANYLRKWIMWLLHRMGEKKWSANVKRLENEINASSSKKTAEQLAYARRQSTDVMAKQSQTRIDHEQLQTKYQRVAQLYEDAKNKLGSLTKEHEKAVQELEDVKNKKVLLDEANCEKITEILRLTQAVAPLEEELLAVRGVLGEREQKLMTLQAQLSAFQRKVQQLTHGGGRTTSGSFTGGQSKAVQTALSAKSVGAELDAILFNRKGSSLFDFSGSGRMSGSFVMTTDIDLEAEGGVRVVSPTLSGASDDHHPNQHPVPAAVPHASAASPEKRTAAGGVRERGAKGARSDSVSADTAALLQKPGSSVNSLSLRTPRQDSLIASGGHTPALSDVLSSTDGPVVEGENTANPGPKRRSVNKSKRRGTGSTPSAQSTPNPAALSPQSTASITPPISSFPSLAHHGPPELDVASNADDHGGPRRRLSSTLASGDVVSASSPPKKASSMRKSSSKFSEGAMAGRKESTNVTTVPRRRAVSLNASLLSDGVVGHVGDDDLLGWGTAAVSSASAETTTSFVTPLSTVRATSQRPAVPTMDRACSALALNPSPPVMISRDAQTDQNREDIDHGITCVETDTQVFPEHVAPPSGAHRLHNAPPLDSSLVAASDEYELAEDASTSVSGQEQSFGLASPPPQAVFASPSLRDAGHEEALGASLRRSTSLSISDHISPKAAAAVGSTTTKPFVLSDSSKWHSALKELKQRGGSIAGTAGHAESKSTAVSKMGHMIDSARRLFDIMGIPQNVLVKTTDELEMMDALRHVLDAASIVVTQQQQQQQRQQQQKEQSALSSSFRFSNQQQQQQQQNASFVMSSPIAAGSPPSLSPQLTSPLVSPRNSVATAAVLPTPHVGGTAARASQQVQQGGTTTCDGVSFPPILSPRAKPNFEALVSPQGKSTVPSGDMGARLPAVTQGRRTQQPPVGTNVKKPSLCIDTRRSLVGGDPQLLQPSLSPRNAQPHTQTPPWTSTHADPSLLPENGAMATPTSPHPPHEPVANVVEASPPMEGVLLRKETERERISARTNVAVMLQQEMLRRQPPDAHRGGVDTDEQLPSPTPPQRPNQGPSKRPLGGQYIRSLR